MCAVLRDLNNPAIQTDQKYAGRLPPVHQQRNGIALWPPRCRIDDAQNMSDVGGPQYRGTLDLRLGNESARFDGIDRKVGCLHTLKMLLSIA